jgi:hypothetical protein
MLIQKSTRKGKRFMATFANGKVVHFGASNASTYIDHGDKAKRSAYIARHKVNENWSNPYSPSALSRFLSWGDSTSLEANHQAFMRKFGVN